MLDRRKFMMAGTAALAATPAAAHSAEGFDATIRASDLPSDFLPQTVDIRPEFYPYEIHVVPQEFALYWTLPYNMALRYTVGIGRPGLYEDGEFYIGARREWPSWRPTDAMIRRDPESYQRYQDGLPGGPGNPLGARALYLYQPGRGDTMLRIHGTDRPETLGRAVSNGCARLVNDQIVELYARVPLYTPVVLYPSDGDFTLLI